MNDPTPDIDPSSPGDAIGLEPPGPIVLAPGPYIIELATARPIDSKALLDGLAVIGFSDGDDGPPALDASQNDRTSEVAYPPEQAARLAALATFQEWARPPEGAASSFRFVGVLKSETVLQDTADVRWDFAGEVRFDPFADIRKTVVPFPLEEGRIYDVRFISRMKAQATRQRVLEALAIMGFRPATLSCLKKNIRLEGRSGTDCALWCGRVVWEGPRTVLTVEDPLSFEDVVEVEHERSDENGDHDGPGHVSRDVPGAGGEEPGGGAAGPGGGRGTESARV